MTSASNVPLLFSLFQAQHAPLPSGGLSWCPRGYLTFPRHIPGAMSHKAPTIFICSFGVCLSPKTDSVLAGRGRGFEEGDGNVLVSRPQALARTENTVGAQVFTQRAGSLLRVQRGALWQSARPGLQAKFPAAAPRKQAEVPTLPMSPHWACLSLFHPWPLCACQPESPSQIHSPVFPRNQPAAPSCLQPNLCKVIPAGEKRKSWPGVQWPKEEGPP